MNDATKTKLSQTIEAAKTASFYGDHDRLITTFARFGELIGLIHEDETIAEDTREACWDILFLNVGATESADHAKKG